MYVLIYTNDDEIKLLCYCADKTKLEKYRKKLLKDSRGARNRNDELDENDASLEIEITKRRRAQIKEFIKKYEYALITKDKIDDIAKLLAQRWIGCLYKLDKYLDMRYVHEKLTLEKFPKQPEFEEEYSAVNLTIHEVEELL